MPITSIVERAAKLGLRFDVRGLRGFVLVDQKTGEMHDFQDTDALTDFLTQDRRAEAGPRIGASGSVASSCKIVEQPDAQA